MTVLKSTSYGAYLTLSITSNKYSLACVLYTDNSYRYGWGYLSGLN